MAEDLSPIKIKGCVIRMIKWTLSRAQDVDFTFKENNNQTTREETVMGENERSTVSDV